MFKKFLSTTPQISENSFVQSPSSPSRSPPSPSPSTSTKPTKMSPTKAAENSNVSPSAQIRLTKHGNYANVHDNDSNKDIPDLILPPSPPSEITTVLDANDDQSPSSGEILRGHTRDDSLQTTMSQSMDLSSFIKILELQQEENLKQKMKQSEVDPKHNAPKRSSGGCDSSQDGSLSLAASQVDISLAEDTEKILGESALNESESKNSDNDNENAKKMAENEPNNKGDSELVETKAPTDSSTINHSSSQPVRHTSNDSSTMAQVGEQLFRECLKAGNEVNDPNKTQAAKANDIPEQHTSKNSTSTFATKSLTILFVTIIIVLFLFPGKGDIKPDDVTHTMTLSSGSHVTIQECDVASKSDPQVADIDRFQMIDSRQVSSDSSNLLVEKLSGLPNSTESNHVDDQMNDKTLETRNASEPNDDESHGWLCFLFLNGWPMALLFVAYRFVSSLRFYFVLSSSTSKKVPMETKTKIKTPQTPKSASTRRNQDGFLTPPLCCESIAHEPSEWMSPCYGDDAIDISVYKEMKHAELRMLLRDRKCDTRGKKEQMIKMLVMSYQNELACLTVKQLRPKLRRRNLSLQGTKKQIVRRLVEAGPDMPAPKA